MENYRFRGWIDMITPDDPKFKGFIKENNEKDYEVLVDKLPPGESIACIDDKDMTIIKEPDGTILLSKKAFKNCFF